MVHIKIPHWSVKSSLCRVFVHVMNILRPDITPKSWHKIAGKTENRVDRRRSVPWYVSKTLQSGIHATCWLPAKNATEISWDFIVAQ